MLSLARLEATLASQAFHEPVLLDEVLEKLRPRQDSWIVDATLGTGGHARAVLERLGPEGRLFGIDRDSGEKQYETSTTKTADTDS